MVRYHEMADGQVRPCEGCTRCQGGKVLPSLDEARVLAYRENEIVDGRNWVANNTGNVVTTLLDGDRVSLRDGAGHKSVPMPDVLVLVNLDTDKQGNALTPAQVRSRARTSGTAPLPEARYNGLPRGSNRDPVWGAQWGKGNSFTMPCATPSSRLVPRRLQSLAKDMIDNR